MIARTTLLLLLCCALPASAQALSLGYVSGPDWSETIDVTFVNDSDQDIVMLTMDGSTATAYPLVWSDPGTVTAPPGSLPLAHGLGTSLLTVGFLTTPDGWNPGETFSLLGLDVDGDPGPATHRVSDLVGVEVAFTFRDSSTYTGYFVDDPNGGLLLTGGGGSSTTRPTPAPEPTSPVLFGCGLLAVASRLRSRRR